MISDLAVAAACRWPQPLFLWFLRKTTGTQITPRQLQLIARTVQSRPGCNLLIFGLGYDSVYWQRLNRAGHTLFLEDDDAWIGVVLSETPGLNVERVTYETRLRDWRELTSRTEDLILALPEAIAQRPWDVIVVDAPAGWSDDSPGRMQSIYTASRLCRPGGTVFVHDCERDAEAFWCDHVFGPALFEQEIPGPRKHGWLRQYRSASGDPNQSTPHRIKG